ncbi:DEKNAAC103775 [Brettanomyces naardenensis]|uniref:DEKNAAC103775 n=1 Tax=Brettanomyces naardenensis TaxID=13370 RepID=A0A448YPA1_BRENA|nr:DEKNAAC103775 [Brettanomyces naardenensis]
MSREFIAKQYPWFLNTWDKYKFPIERADAIRYFALAHFGGIYIDLDDGCRRRLDPLLTVPAFVRSTSPSGVSNDIMGSVPGHPFFIKVLNNLKRYNRNWLVPYITIMFSTGPLFLSVILEQYNRYGVPDTGKVRVLLPADYKGNDDSFLKIAPGSSWHTDDAKFIKTLGRHIPLAVFTGFMITGLVFLMEWYLYKWCVRLNFSRMKEKVRGWFNKGRMGRPRKDSNLPAQRPLVKIEVV